MRVIVQGGGSVDRPPTGMAWTLGNFDGVHLGHRALLERTRSLAPRAGALTFDPPPRDVLRPDNGVPRLQSLASRIDALLDAGLEAVVVVGFDRDMASWTPSTFAGRMLAPLEPVALAVGPDFRFGVGRSGGPADLREALGVEVIEQPAVCDASGAAVSSSAIRAALRVGDVAQAAAGLGRPHRVRGTVVRGDGRGRTLGFPTANLEGDGGMLPADGVYAATVRVGERLAAAVCHLGPRPTFAGLAFRFEVHLLDGAAELTGTVLEVAFVARLRGVMRFDGPSALVAQIHTDVAAARRVLAP